MARAKAKRRMGKGALMAVSLLLISSAVVRVGMGAGSAWAQAGETTEEAITPVVEEKEAMPELVMSAPAPSNRAEVGRLLEALQQREARVKELEEQIERRSKALSVADAEIARRLQSLEEAEEKLRRTLALADGAAEDDLARLTAVYENMKPKDAAALFEAMEPDFAAGFLGRMRPDAAASIMAGLAPETAYSISVILAGRNATAPKS